MNIDFKQIELWVQDAYSWPSWAIAAALVLAFGYCLRAWVAFPNQAIPLVCLLMGGIFTELLAPGAPQSFDAHRWRALNFAIGAVVGLLAWLLHKYVLKKIEDKLPWVKDILGGIDDSKTEFLTRQQAGVPQPSPVNQTQPPSITKP